MYFLGGDTLKPEVEAEAKTLDFLVRNVRTNFQSVAIYPKAKSHTVSPCMETKSNIVRACIQNVPYYRFKHHWKLSCIT